MSDGQHVPMQPVDYDRRDEERRSALEGKLEDIDRRLDEGDARMSDLGARLDRLTAVLETLVAHMAGVPEHIASVCRLADAVRTLFRPVGWLVENLRKVLLWLAATVVALTAIEVWMQRQGVEAPWPPLVRRLWSLLGL